MKKLALLFTILLMASSCDVNQKKEMELPEVDIDIDTEAGQLPTFDVDWADVNVGMKTEMVSVPKVVVVMEEVEVEVPYLDVDMPNSGEKEEMKLIVEAEVTDKEHEIKIQEIVASQNNIYVISKLTEKTTALGDKKLRVSDQVILNAPDLNVKHIIIGEKPDRVFNDQYKYVKDISSFKANLKKSKVIYTR